MKLAQVAEIIALTRAYQLVKDQKVNKHTESRYGVVHDLGMFWKQRVFLTSVWKLHQKWTNEETFLQVYATECIYRGGYSDGCGLCNKRLHGS